MKGDSFPALSDADHARVIEIFSSLQGEGIHLGERQIFVRFGGCNLHCDYCDTPESIPVPAGTWRSRDNILEEVAGLNASKKHRSVSLTGGEPLLHAPFLETFLPRVRGLGLRTYLETHGILADAFARVAAFCDTVSMDIKLPSAVGRELWEKHLLFLKVAPNKTFVKVVLTARTTDAEWQRVIRLMQESGVRIPLVLQPSTRVADRLRPGEFVESIQPRRAVEYFRQARGVLKNVRLIPQWHPIWGLK